MVIEPSLAISRMTERCCLEAQVSFDTLIALFGVACDLGLVAFIGFSIKWYWNRLRWQRFEASIRSWTHETFNLDLRKDEWKSLVAIKLSEVAFSPAEIRQLLDVAVLVAKAITAIEERGKV